MNLKVATHALLGLAIALACSWFVFSSFDWQTPLLLLKTANLEYFPLLIALICLSVQIRSARWGKIVAIESVINYSKISWLGYLCNFILPMRLGEVVKVSLASKLLDIHVISVISKSVFDRMLDLIALLLLLFSSFIFYESADFIDVSLAIKMLFLGITFFIIFIALKAKKLSLATKVPYLGNAIAKIVASTKEVEYEVIKKSATLTFSAFVIDVAATLSMVKVLGIDIPAHAAFIIALFFYLGALLPSTPAQVGVHQSAAVFSLGLFSVNSDIAISYSIIQQIVTFMCLLICAGSLWLISSLKSENVSHV